MLYLSPIEKRCAERTGARGLQETTLEWDGEVANGFGIVVVSWRGSATYRFQDGRLLTADPCPNETCLMWTTQRLWEVDRDGTTVTTTPVANATPEEAILAYRVTWGIWFPKVTLKGAASRCRRQRATPSLGASRYAATGRGTRSIKAAIAPIKGTAVYRPTNTGEAQQR